MWILQTLFSIKYLSLAFLVLQNTFLVVLMHVSRTHPPEDGILYSSSTAVVTMEVIKFVCCLSVITYEKAGFTGLVAALREDVWEKPTELVKLAVPSVLYSVQNNLLYYALSHLDAATYQVGYSLKLLTTAVFSWFMLGKHLGLREWSSLILLTVGVSLAQLAASQSKDVHAELQRNTMMGFVAVLFAACISGFSGVYFEKVLKSSSTSLWMRNVQMGVSSLMSATLGIYLSGEWPAVRSRGFFSGYNSIVLSVVLLQALGGLIVAVVVKYADNILKGFAASFSIITSCLFAYLLGDFQPSTRFVVGAVLVNVAMYLYSTPSAWNVLGLDGLIAQWNWKDKSKSDDTSVDKVTGHGGQNAHSDERV